MAPATRETDGFYDVEEINGRSPPEEVSSVSINSSSTCLKGVRGKRDPSGRKGLDSRERSRASGVLASGVPPPTAPIGAGSGDDVGGGVSYNKDGSPSSRSAGAEGGDGGWDGDAREASGAVAGTGGGSTSGE